MMKTIKKIFKDLTFETLQEWAGDRIYQRGEGYVSLVSQLSRTSEGAVAAWVAGSDNYATTIKRDEQGNLEAFCTCPYSGYGPCKHVVAVLLVAAENIKQKRDFPLLDPGDDLYLELWDGADEDFAAEDFEDISEQKAARDNARTKLTSLLAGKGQEELRELLISVALEFPEVGRRIREVEQLAKGQVGAIVRSLRREIRELTSEDAWYDSWKGEGSLPDYDHLEQQLRALVDQGHGDAVLELGEELWKRGIKQVADSHDDGETAMAISDCMEVVVEALPYTQLTLSKQLLWLVDRELEDEYSMFPEKGGIFDDPKYTEQQWDEAVGVLRERLVQKPSPKGTAFSERYQRKQLLDWLVTAYTRSGRSEEVIPLLEQEVENCDNYQQLVDTLIAAGNLDRARYWCIRGFEKTQQEKSGIAAALQGRLRLLAEEEGRFDLACAYRAEDFFETRSEKSFTELRQAAERIEIWPVVRKATLHYLQTGQRPDHEGVNVNDWPVMEPEVKAKHSRKNFAHQGFPDWNMLLEIALLEQRLEDAIAIYQESPKKTWWSWGTDERLAAAVTTSHPDVALQIWKTIADDLIAQVKPSAYRDAAKYLRRMRTIYEDTGRLADWLGLVKDLRKSHNRKRRLMEVLDRLEANQRLID
jgi:uncharacterized Zn finger protein